MSIFKPMSLPEVYERFLVEPLFRPFAEEVVNRLHPTPDDSMLDVACGTGIVARCARRRLGPQARIVGVDAAPPMLAVARRADSTIDWRDGNAMALPVQAGEQFSVVACHQGLQFFQDKPAAVREMRRVLARGGRVAIATWLAPADIPFADGLHKIAERHLGPTVDLRRSFADGRAFSPLLSEAGFTDIQVEMVSAAVRGIDGPAYARLNAMAIVGMSPKAKTLGDAERAELIERVATDSLPVVDKFTRNGVFEFTLATNVATARA
jgi:ubiquinone/menaquinone biosynthesis C-methylase UbiE